MVRISKLQEVLGWRRDLAGRHDPDAVRGRRAYLRERDPAEIGLITGCVREAREGRTNLAKELAWPIFDELHMIGAALVTSNPLDLVDLADQPGDNLLLVRQRFEALCLVDLAVAMHELEQYDPLDRVDHDLRDMIAFLERRVFSGDSHDLDVHTYHDPDDAYRVREIAYDAPGSFPELQARKHNSPSRITREGVVARFDVRPKSRFATVLKLLRQHVAPKPGHDPFVVYDRCGFKFVVKDLGQAKLLASELGWHLSAAGAEVRDGGDNLTVETGAAADTQNAQSSRKYRKKQFDVLWHKRRWYEFQIMLFRDYYSALYALDEENHVIYKLRQGVRGVLPMLYPGALYIEEGSWEAPELVSLLTERQIQNLGWWAKDRRNGNGHGH